jgi:hypothetical protein
MTQPRPLREDDTLGRAGRTNANGKPIKTERLREPTALDERHRATIEVVGFENPHVVVTSARPLVDGNGKELPVVQGNGDRGLMHLDGKSEPRPPRDWEAMEAARRAEIGKSEREALARSLQRDRRAKKLHERIAWLQQRALVAQSQRAVQVRATDAKSAEAVDQAPQCEGHDAIAYASAAQVAGEWKQIEALVEKLEGYWDAHDGIALKDVSMMTTDEKNALLLGPLLRGLSPEAIHGIYGDPIGKPRTIRHVRSEGGQTGRGLPKPERQERAA